MKKVYIPTTDELYEMQSYGVNIYNYILSKTIEALIVEDIIYEETNMLDIAYEELPEFKEIPKSIIRMYPEAISTSDHAKKDINLCRSLFEQLPSEDKSIYQLDNLIQFDESLQKDKLLVERITGMLAEKLLITPRYRFDYKEPNDLLDNIFSCELDETILTNNIINNLMTLEPIYLIKLRHILKDIPKEKIIFELVRNLKKHSNRYGLKEELTSKNDVLNNPKTKKLIHYLEQHKNNYTL